MFLRPRTINLSPFGEKALIGAVLQTAHDQSPLPLGEG